MTEFEALGKYTFYRELAEAHLTCVKVCGEVMQDMIDRGKDGLLAIDTATTLRLLEQAKQAREHYQRFAALANSAARICGREPLGLRPEQQGAAA